MEKKRKNQNSNKVEVLRDIWEIFPKGSNLRKTQAGHASRVCRLYAFGSSCCKIRSHDNFLDL